jgi:AraC-like DNA-binding protein
MPTSTIAVFSEPRAFEAALQQACGVELLVTGHDKFRARLVSIALPQLRLLQVTEWVSRIAVVSVAPGSMLVILPTEPESLRKFGGTSLLAGEIMTVTAGEPLHTWTGGPCGWGIISVSIREFVGYGKAMVGRKFVLPSGVCRLRPSRGSLQSLMALFNATMRLTEAHPSRPIDTEGAARGLEQEAIGVLIDCLSTATVQASEKTDQQSDIMSRLDELLQTYPHEIPRVPDVCAALGISAKALRACCQLHVGVGPGRYLHLRGMRRVYHALIGSHPGRDSVAGIAKCYGFNGTGGFAAAYRRQFGEFPSATLRRGPGIVTTCAEQGRVDNTMVQPRRSLI